MRPATARPGPPTGTGTRPSASRPYIRAGGRKVRSIVLDDANVDQLDRAAADRVRRLEANRPAIGREASVVDVDRVRTALEVPPELDERTHVPRARPHVADDPGVRRDRERDLGARVTAGRRLPGAESRGLGRDVAQLGHDGVRTARQRAADEHEARGGDGPECYGAAH